MKFTLKNHVFELDGWTAEFKQIKQGAHFKYMLRSGLINRDLLEDRDGEAVIDTNKFTTEQLADFMELDEKFLVSNLIKASNSDEVVESQDQKELFVNWLLTEDDFQVWKDGYLNGVKKT